MGLANKAWFRVVIDIVHDLAAGAWPGAVIALWLLKDAAEGTLTPDAFAAAMRSWSVVLLVMVASLTVLVVTGIVRMNHRGHGVAPELLEARTRAALAKHAVFVLVFVVASVEAFALLQRKGG